MLAKQIAESIREAVCNTVDTRSYSSYQSHQSEALIEKLQQLCAREHCMLTSSGTAALEIGLRAAGIKAGDEVLLSAYDYPGNFWAIERVGAQPALLDCIADGWNIDLRQLEASLAQGNQCIKALVFSHLHGQLQEVAPIRALCHKYGVLLIEDSCQSFGAVIDRNASEFLADMTLLSFGGGKLISSGRGGALLCDDSRLAQKIKIAAGAGSGPYALSEVQAAIVLAQLQWLAELTEHVRNFFAEFAAGIDEGQQNSGTSGEEDQWFLKLPWKSNLLETSFYQAGLLVTAKQSNPDFPVEERIANWLSQSKTSGIRSGQGFSGFHRRSSRRCRITGELTNTPRVVQQTLTLHHSVAFEEQTSGNDLAHRMLNALRVPGR